MNDNDHAIEYVCGGCRQSYVGLSAFSVHATRHHDYENVSEAVKDCYEVREVSDSGGQTDGQP